MISQLVLNLIGNLIYDALKKGFRKNTYSYSVEDLLRELNKKCLADNDNRKDVFDDLEVIKNNQSVLFYMLCEITKTLEMKTNFAVFDNKINIVVDTEDIFSLKQNNISKVQLIRPKSIEIDASPIKALSYTPTKDEIEQMIISMKEHICFLTPTVHTSIVFSDWLKSKGNKKSLLFEINKKGYYSISRAEINNKIPHDSHLYLVNTENTFEYYKTQISENTKLSNVNNIVFYSDTNKGMVVAVSGTL